MKRIFATSITVLALTLGGCATSRSVIDIQPPIAQAGLSNGKQVFIKSAIDVREFQVSPSSQEIPSLDPSEDQSDKIKQRAVGRKRNTYGMALGDVLVSDGQTVESIITQSIKQAFTENGYKVVSSSEQVNRDTYIVDAKIEKFWSWTTPGFASITLSAEISTDLTINSPEGGTNQKVYAKAFNNYQIGSESNRIEIISAALRQYVKELKSKLK